MALTQSSDPRRPSSAEVDESNNTDGGSAGDGNLRPDRNPLMVFSPSDPQSAWTARANKRVLFGYGLSSEVGPIQFNLSSMSGTDDLTFQ